MLGILTFIAIALCVVIAFKCCAYGFVGALIGLFAGIFLPYSYEACATWGFAIGLVVQLFVNWRQLLTVVVSGGIGFLIALGIGWVLQKFGVSYKVCQVVEIYCFAIPVYIGSEWIREGFGSFVDGVIEIMDQKPNYSISNSDDRNKNCSNCEHYFNGRCSLNHKDVRGSDICNGFHVH